MINIVLTILGVLFAIIFHECAHGWVAYKCGDPTAKQAGRLTLNPIKHIDPIGTILIPGILIFLSIMGANRIIFGWAKPVPVNFAKLRQPKRDMMLVGMAGPAINIIIAFIIAQMIRLGMFQQYHDALGNIVFINLLLAIFNMIPIPPLDGSRLVMGLLPNSMAIHYVKLERFGILIVFGLLYLGLFEKLVLPIAMKSMNMLGI